MAAAVLALVGGLLLAGAVAAVVRPYDVLGSAHHGSAVAEIIRLCADDEGEAVASGASRPGARDDCLHEAKLHFVAGAVLLLAGVGTVALAVTIGRVSPPGPPVGSRS